MTDAPTGVTVAADAPTSMAPAAWAATDAVGDGTPSSTFRALAWSQGDEAGEEPVPYTGADYAVTPPTGGQSTEFEPGHPNQGHDLDTAVVQGVLPWYRRPSLLSPPRRWPR